MSIKPIAYMLCEATTEPSNKYNIVKEGSSNNGRVSVQTTLQSTEVFNRNNRRYFKKHLQPALEAPHIKELQSRRSWMGECGHPMSNTGKITLERMMTIMPDRVAIRVDKHWWDGNTVKGIVSAAETPLGDMFQRLVLDGQMESAYSLRAMGAVQATSDRSRAGNDVIGPMRVVAYDWVFVPSHEDAYQDHIITEALQASGLGDYTYVMESAAYAIAEEDAVAFVKAESKNLSFVSELLDFCYESINLSPDKRSIIVNEAGTNNKLFIKLEEAIAIQINEHLRKLKSLRG